MEHNLPHTNRFSLALRAALNALLRDLPEAWDAPK